MKSKNSSSSPQFKPVMTCPVGGEVSYWEYDHGRDPGYKLSGNRLMMLDKDGNRSIFDDVDL